MSSTATPSINPRSQFIFKLHHLLDNPADPESLRWVNDGTAFEVTVNEARSRASLSPEFDFRSLSSFIRQLSYYNFKRLSDRRRSSERRTSTNGYIVFMHPSGIFVRGDSSRLHEITRKARSRPEKSSRRASTSSALSAAVEQYDEDETAAASWSTPSTSSYQFPGEFSDSRRSSHPFPPLQNSLSQPEFGGGGLGSAPAPMHNDLATWRTYTPPHWNDGRRPSDPGVDMRARRPEIPRPRVSYHGVPSDDFRTSSHMNPPLPPPGSVFQEHPHPVPTGLAMPFDGPSSYAPSGYTTVQPFPSPSSSHQYPSFDSRREISHHVPAPQLDRGGATSLPHERQLSYEKASTPYFSQPLLWAPPPPHHPEPPHYQGKGQGEGS